METSQSIHWLKESGLYEESKLAAEYLKSVFSNSFRIGNEKILILGDKGKESKNLSAIISGAYYYASQLLKLNSKLLLMDDDSAIESSVIDLKSNDCLILALSEKLRKFDVFGKSFRKYCKNNGIRFASTTSLGDLTNHNIYKIFETNPGRLSNYQQSLLSSIDKGKSLQIKTDAGTDILCDIEEISGISSDGLFDKPGMGGNIPAGEVYFAVKKKGINGKVVIDGSSRNHQGTRLLDQPIIIQIEDGIVTGISGGRYADELKASLELAKAKAKKPKNVIKIGEVGIGMNQNIKVIGCSSIDEKAAGTAHIGIGSNYWFGGTNYSIIHYDQVFLKPKIYIDGNEVLV